MPGKREYRRPTRQELAAMRRAIDLAILDLAHYEMVKLALRGRKPEDLRRELKRMRQLLEPGADQPRGK